MATDFYRRVFGGSAIVSRGGAIEGVDIATLVNRLLLFDGYVLRTIRFREFPHFLTTFGYDQTLELLTCGLLEICSEVLMVGSERDAELRRLQKPTFSLVWVEAHDWDKYVADCLKDIESQLSLPSDKWHALESGIRRCIRRLDPVAKDEIGASFKTSAYGSKALLIESIRLAAKRRRIPIVLPNFQIDIEENGDLINMESDLRYTRIPREELWEILRDGLMGIGSLENSIGQMKHYTAIGGFQDEELPLFERRLSGLASLVLPGNTEKRMTRISRIVGLPRFEAVKTRVNIEKLLRARESDDLRAFRDWLATSDALNDKQVKHLLKGYRAVISTFGHSGSVTISRLVIEAAAGVVSSIAGIVLSALDSFLVDKLFRRSGPAAFINKTYPSLFEKPK